MDPLETDKKVLSLLELLQGEKGTVTRISAPKELRDRLHSFGVGRDATVVMGESALGKSTIKVKINNTMIALRDNEAESIEVVRVDS